VKVRRLGRVAYLPTWRAMQAFTDARNAATVDELWLVEHPPVYTLGLAGRPEHIHDAGSTPVIRADRGGQVTYHGPGQAIAYALVDLRRAGLGVRGLVHRLEAAVIDTLAQWRIEGRRDSGRPGVYVDGKKIAAIGLRIARGCSYHGLALNVDTPLEPFARIDPCGFAGLEVTSLERLGVRASMAAVHDRLAAAIATAVEPAIEPA
jgi:lipoyl(octanoyl) transferase